MGVYQLKNAPEIDVELRRSSRARRLSLRVSSLDGRVTLTVPPGTPERVARAFAEEKARWLQAAVDKVRAPVPVVPGAVLPVLGTERRVITGRARAARLDGDVISAPPGREGVAIRVLLKQLARTRLQGAAQAYADALGRPFGRMTLRDTRSRWGSCSSEGNLMFSWRLILAPPEVLDYVAAHEVAHLQHMDHSPAFWDTCRSLFPDTDTQRRWLRQHGADLHRYRFD